MELNILHWFESLHNPITNPIMYGITFLGDKGWFWLVLCAAFLFIPAKYFKDNRKLGLAMIIALLLSVIMCNGLMKNIFERERAFWVPGSTPDNFVISTEEGNEHTFENLYDVFSGIDDWSFPSGHTSASFAAAIAILLYSKKKGALATVLAALIAFSRLYLTVHFLTDVLVSLVLGSLYGVIGYYLSKLILSKSDKMRAVFLEGASYKTLFTKSAN